MKIYWGKFSTAFNARHKKERIIISLVLAVLIINFWFLLIADDLNAAQAVLENEAASLDQKIMTESERYQALQSSQDIDPNSQIKERIAQLQTATIKIDEELKQLYGELILPEEMAIVLSTILQNETLLRLVSLENLPSERLFSAGIDAATPLVGGTNTELLSGDDAARGVKVFKHGLELKFSGGYLDTIFYLRNLEALSSNFLWEDLVFSLDEYPNASVSFKIFTFSTQKEWIGV